VDSIPRILSGAKVAALSKGSWSGGNPVGTVNSGGVRCGIEEIFPGLGAMPPPIPPARCRLARYQGNMRSNYLETES
jgi:hypothetical protein